MPSSLRVKLKTTADCDYWPSTVKKLVKKSKVKKSKFYNSNRSRQRVKNSKNHKFNTKFYFWTLKYWNTESLNNEHWTLILVPRTTINDFFQPFLNLSTTLISINATSPSDYFSVFTRTNHYLCLLFKDCRVVLTRINFDRFLSVELLSKP